MDGALGTLDQGNVTFLQQRRVLRDRLLRRRQRVASGVAGLQHQLDRSGDFLGSAGPFLLGAPLPLSQIVVGIGQALRLGRLVNASGKAGIEFYFGFLKIIPGPHLGRDVLPIEHLKESHR
jgi:hypothetical protein